MRNRQTKISGSDVPRGRHGPAAVAVLAAAVPAACQRAAVLLSSALACADSCLCIALTNLASQPV